MAIGASLVFASAGVAFTSRGIMDLGDPAFANPKSLFDYSAVIGTTAAMMLLGIGLALVTRGGGLKGRARSIVWVPIAALTLSGTANLLEDAFGVSALGIMFGIGNLFVVVGLLATGISAVIDRRNTGALRWLILALGAAFFLPVTISWVVLGLLCLAIAAQQIRKAPDPLAR